MQHLSLPNESHYLVHEDQFLSKLFLILAWITLTKSELY